MAWAYPQPITATLLTQEGTVRDLEQFADDCVKWFQVKEAYLVGAALESLAKETPSLPFTERYRSVVAKLKFTSLHLWSEQDIASLFQVSLAIGLRLGFDFDLWERLRIKLIGLPYEARDQIKQGLFNAITSSREPLFAQPLTDASGKSVSATVGNVVGDYQRFVQGGPASSMEQAQYLTKSTTFASSPEDRKVLEKLVVLVERFKRSSLTPEGIDDEPLVRDYDGRLKRFVAGELVDLGIRTERVQPPPVRTARPLVPSPLRPIMRPAPAPTPRPAASPTLRPVAPRPSPRPVPPPVPIRPTPAPPPRHPPAGGLGGQAPQTSIPDPYSTLKSILANLRTGSRDPKVLFEEAERELTRLVERGKLEANIAAPFRSEVRDLLTIMSRPQMVPLEKKLVQEGIEDWTRKLEQVVGSRR